MKHVSLSILIIILSISVNAQDNYSLILSNILTQNLLCDSSEVDIFINDSTKNKSIYEYQIINLLKGLKEINNRKIKRRVNKNINKSNKINDSIFKSSKYRINKLDSTVRKLSYNSNWDSLYSIYPEFCTIISLSDPVEFKYKKNSYIIIYIEQLSGPQNGIGCFRLYKLDCCEIPILINEIVIWLS